MDKSIAKSFIKDKELLQKVCDKLDKLERETYYSTGIKYHSGGFAEAEVYRHDEEYLDIELKWGIQNDATNVVHIENYKLNLQTMEFEDG